MHSYHTRTIPPKIPTSRKLLTGNADLLIELINMKKYSSINSSKCLNEAVNQPARNQSISFLFCSLNKINLIFDGSSENARNVACGTNRGEYWLLPENKENYLFMPSEEYRW